MKIFGIILKAFVLAIIVVFAAFNMEKVNISYFVGKEPLVLPLFMVMLIVFLLGMIAVYILFVGDRLSLNKELSRAKRDIKKLNDELIRLRNLPLLDNVEKGNN